MHGLVARVFVAWSDMMWDVQMDELQGMVDKEKDAFSTPEISESHFVVSFQYDVATSRYV